MVLRARVVACRVVFESLAQSTTYACVSAVCADDCASVRAASAWVGLPRRLWSFAKTGFEMGKRTHCVLFFTSPIPLFQFSSMLYWFIASVQMVVRARVVVSRVVFYSFAQSAMGSGCADICSLFDFHLIHPVLSEFSNIYYLFIGCVQMVVRAHLVVCRVVLGARLPFHPVIYSLLYRADHSVSVVANIKCTLCEAVWRHFESETLRFWIWIRYIYQFSLHLFAGTFVLCFGWCTFTMF